MCKKSDLHKKKLAMTGDTRQNVSEAHELKKLNLYQKKLATMKGTKWNVLEARESASLTPIFARGMKVEKSDHHLCSSSPLAWPL